MRKETDLTTGGKDLLDDASNYDKNKYPKAANTVDICICRFFNDEVQVLLIKRKYNPFKEKFAIPGGFVDIDKAETLETAALRELQEETGMTGIPVSQFKTYGDPGRDPRDRTISTVYYALLKNSLLDRQKIKASDDAKEYAWYALRDLPQGLAFDHQKILSDLWQFFKERIFCTTDAFFLLEDIFTLVALKKIYEYVLERGISDFSGKISQFYDLELINPEERQYRLIGLKKFF